MRFRPREKVVLNCEDGASVLARPFFFTEGFGGGIKVELLTDSNRPLRCVDEAKGIYADSKRLLVVRSAMRLQSAAP